MRVFIFLFLFLTYFSDTFGKQEFYFITLPNVLMTESPHLFNFHTSIDLKLVIETYHSLSQIKFQSPMYIIEKGYKSITYHVPFVGNHVGSNLRLRFLGDRCSDLSKCNSKEKVVGKFLNQTYVIDLIDKNYIVFSETDKPIYKPGEKVKLRFMPVYPTNLMEEPEKIGQQWKIILTGNDTQQDKYYTYKVARKQISEVFEVIYIENPQGIRVAQWKNVSLLNAMNLDHQLTKDPEYGLWKAKAIFQGKDEVAQFTVKKYVLPRFVVDVIPPNEILAKDKFIEFEICAKYSTGKQMKARLYGTFCFGYDENYKLCESFKSELIKQKCAKISLKTEKLFDSQFHRYSRSKSFINVTVIENGTSSSVSKVVESTGISYTDFEIKLESPKYYKPGLPYFGRLRLVRHSKEPQSNTTVNIKVDGFYQYDWGFNKNYTSDKSGLIQFIIPYVPLESSISIQVMKLKDKPDSPMANIHAYYPISNWESLDKQYLQILPVKGPIICPGTLNLSILVNSDISSINLYAQIFARGHISEMIEFPAIPVKCESRNDFLGHYNCVENNKIKCLPGWTGDNCREPICNEKCLKGACIEPDKCICKNGWKGKNCDQCIIADYCKHGYCIYGFDCRCYPGWTNYDCSIKGPKRHYYYTRITDKPQTVKPIIRNIYEKETIYERIINIPLLKHMGPDIHIIIYYINDNNEVIADSIEITDGLKNCSNLGGGKFEFDKENSLPKSKVKLLIDPGTKKASCAVRISDIALSQFGRSSNANLAHLVDTLIKLNHKITNVKQMMESCIRSNSSLIMYGYNRGYDSEKAFRKAGFTAITNARTINSKCEYPIIMHYALETNMRVFDSPDSLSLKPAKKAPMDKVKKQVDVKLKVEKQIREFFPESWVFSYYNNSVKQLNLTVPDSMTTWQADSYCMTEKGLWISPSKRLKVVMPFFVNIYVPYSLKLGEDLALPIKIFNYADTCYEINVQANVNRNEIKIVGMKSFTLCVCSNDEKTLYFNTRPLVIGKLNITVYAQSKYSTFCSNSKENIKNKTKNINIEMYDAIRRQLLVEPAGVPTETTFSQLICNKNEQLGVVDVYTIPTNIVPGSLRSYLKFNGDAMGQTFDNLDKLVKMPYGCGEQNMMAVVPSIYVLQYLTQLKIHNPILSKKAKEYILQGYSRQLNYKHNDGSFSAFGKSDKAGSTWLTAFVLKSFSDAKRYVSIQDSMLLEAVKYLEKMQSNNGCFKEKGKLFSSTMAGGAGKESKTDESLLSAYILISLKDVNLTKNAFNIAKAVQCVTSELGTNSSNYRLAMSAFVLSIYQPNSKLTISVIEQLRKRAVTTSRRYKHWPFDQDSKDSSKVKAADIETTGYAFLALQNYESSQELLKVVYWLSNQRNSLGGYYSTQDTVVALNALAVFAESIGLSNVMNLSVSVTLNEEKNYVDFLNPENRLLLKNIDLGSENISYISIKTKGSGCLSIQLISLYNIEKLYSDTETFKLSVKTDVTSSKMCSFRQIKVCFAYLRLDKNSNMILVTIDYPSGWKLSEEEATNIRKQIVTPLNRVDFHENTMDLYYDAFSYNDANKEICFQFKLEEKSKIENLKPALVRITDYYNPGVYTDASYTMFNKICNDTKTNKPKMPKVLLCPSCVGHSKESRKRFMETICTSWFVGFVSRSGNGTKDRILYQPFPSMYYEWKLDLQPENCSCLKTWSHLNDDFIILSSRWKSLTDKLELSNDSVMFPIKTLHSAFQYDLYNQCSVAHDLYSMMERIQPDFSNKTSKNHSCPTCILYSNYYFAIKNLTQWYCSENATQWELNVTSVSPKINGILKMTNETVVTDVEIEFPNNLCFCYEKLLDTTKTFEIIDLENIVQILMNKKKARPIKLLLDNRFEIVEKSVISKNSYVKC